MRYPLTVPGMEGHNIQVTTATLLKPPQVLIDDFPAPEGSKKGEFLIYRPDGTTATLLLTGHPLDIVPQVRVNGRRLELTEPLEWHEWLLIGLPLVLLFLGVVGGVLGGIAAVVNVYLVRSSQPAVVRSLSALGMAFLAFAVVLPIAVIEHRRAPAPPPVYYSPPPPSARPRSFFHSPSFFRHRSHRAAPPPPAPSSSAAPAPSAATP